MPTNDPNYMRDYQKRRRQEKAAVKDVKIAPADVKEQAPETVGVTRPLDKKSRYNCGCEPGLLCTSHAIARLSQKTRDQLLDRINNPTRKIPGK